MQNSATRKSIRARSFLFCIFMSGHAAVQNNPAELSQNAATGLLAGCGAIICYKVIKSLQRDKENYERFEKFSASAPLQVLVAATLGCTFISATHLQKFIQAIFNYKQ